MSGVNTECGRWACGPCALDLDTLDDTPCFVCRDSIRDQEHLWRGTESNVCCKYCIVERPLCNQCVPLLPSHLQALLVNMCVALAPLDWPVLVLLSVYEWCVPDFCSVGAFPLVLQWAIAAKAKKSAVACSALQTKSN